MIACRQVKKEHVIFRSNNEALIVWFVELTVPAVVLEVCRSSGSVMRRIFYAKSPKHLLIPCIPGTLIVLPAPEVSCSREVFQNGGATPFSRLQSGLCWSTTKRPMNNLFFFYFPDFLKLFLGSPISFFIVKSSSFDDWKITLYERISSLDFFIINHCEPSEKSYTTVLTVSDTGTVLQLQVVFYWAFSIFLWSFSSANFLHV